MKNYYTYSTILKLIITHTHNTHNNKFNNMASTNIIVSTSLNNLIDCGKKWKKSSLDTNNCNDCENMRNEIEYLENTAEPNKLFGRMKFNRYAFCNKCTIRRANNMECKCNKCVCSKLAWVIHNEDFKLIEETIENLSPNACSIALLKLVPIVNDLKIIEKLIVRGADVNFNAQYDADNFQISNSLRASVTSKMGLPMVKFLLEHGANPNLCVGKDNVLFGTFFSSLSNRNKDVSEIIELLLRFGLDIEKSGATLNDVVVTDNITLIKYFLTHPDFESNYKKLDSSPLSVTSLSSKPEVLDLLFSNPLIRADVNKPNKKGKTPLHNAIYIKHEKYNLIERLLRYGANPYIKDEEGRMCFQYSFKIEDIKIVKLLLLYGVSFSEIIPNLYDFKYSTEKWESILDWNSYMLLYCLSQLDHNLNNIMTPDIVEELVQIVQSIKINKEILSFDDLRYREHMRKLRLQQIQQLLQQQFQQPQQEQPQQHPQQEQSVEIDVNMCRMHAINDEDDFEDEEMQVEENNYLLQPPKKLEYIRTSTWSRFPIIDFLNQLGILDGYSYISRLEYEELKISHGHYH